jgi:hypothetical protein
MIHSLFAVHGLAARPGVQMFLYIEKRKNDKSAKTRLKFLSVVPARPLAPKHPEQAAIRV